MNWQCKYELYKQLFEYSEVINVVYKPTISIIIISWRLCPELERNLQLLKKQKHNNYQLIFVDNGSEKDEFIHLKKHVDVYIKLNVNTGACVARNMGAVYSSAPLLLFLEDDCLPDENLILAHILMHKKYDIISLRGVCLPLNRDNHLNWKQTHYYLGEKCIPYYADTEGNSSYHFKEFFEVGGWDDNIFWGGEGTDLALRLLKIVPNGVNKYILHTQ